MQKLKHCSCRRGWWFRSAQFCSVINTELNATTDVQNLFLRNVKASFFGTSRPDLLYLVLHVHIDERLTPNFRLKVNFA
ncbi:hypothetical protein L596_017448 [Steinernema carpocapsae]|uniref:Uncharacterized protein n=1 Tax=Steinernema carpocapsae TaxID=34508 RepID=A0A4U5N1Q2_STECR|nr:hypothetical protein L596_017448 [Steinernema carpocapsae]